MHAPSVVWADSTTATRKVNSLSEFSGTGGSGYSLLSVSRIAADLSDDEEVMAGFSERRASREGRRARLSVRSSSGRLQSIACSRAGASR